MKWIGSIAVMVTLLVAMHARAQETTTQPAAAIPREQLEAMYRRELGEGAAPVPFEQMHAAHELVEKYFAAASADERKGIVKSLEEMKVDANAIGKLARIRLNWPELGPGVYYINERVGPHRVMYFLGVPAEYERTRASSLVVQLPGAEAFLTEPRPDEEAVQRIYTEWIKAELGRHPRSIVLMPLLNLDELYGPSYAGMNSVIQPLLHAASRVNIDPARVYMSGHSMAAHAVWNLSVHYPTYFAATSVFAGAMSQDFQRLRLMNLRNTLPVVWHDSEDAVIKVDQARGIVRTLRGLKVDVDYEETKNVGHVPSGEIVERAYGKMMARVREVYPKNVSVQSNRPDTMFNRVDWVQVYQPLRAGAEKKLYFRHGSGRMIVNQNAWAVDAAITGPNRIEASTNNVESMRFYLNDRMIDFTKPVTIVANKKVRFEGMMNASVEEMLKDQVFLGRGCRYFTGVVDIDFVEAPPATKPLTRPATTTLPATRQ